MGILKEREVGSHISYLLNLEPYPVLIELQVTNWRAQEDNACLLNPWDTPPSPGDPHCLEYCWDTKLST